MESEEILRRFFEKAKENGQEEVARDIVRIWTDIVHLVMTPLVEKMISNKNDFDMIFNDAMLKGMFRGTVPDDIEELKQIMMHSLFTSIVMAAQKVHEIDDEKFIGTLELLKNQKV